MTQLTLQFTPGKSPGVNLDSMRANIKQRQLKRFFDVSIENKERSKLETHQINQDFEKRQQEIFSRLHLSLDDAFMARIEQKLLFNDPLSDDEIFFANDNFWLPDGYIFTNFGLIPK